MKRKTFIGLGIAVPIAGVILYKYGAIAELLGISAESLNPNDDFQLGFLDYNNAVELKNMSPEELEKQANNFLRTQFLSIPGENSFDGIIARNNYLENIDYIPYRNGVPLTARQVQELVDFKTRSFPQEFFGTINDYTVGTSLGTGLVSAFFKNKYLVGISMITAIASLDSSKWAEESKVNYVREKLLRTSALLERNNNLFFQIQNGTTDLSVNNFISNDEISNSKDQIFSFEFSGEYLSEFSNKFKEIIIDQNFEHGEFIEESKRIELYQKCIKAQTEMTEKLAREKEEAFLAARDEALFFESMQPVISSFVNSVFEPAHARVVNTFVSTGFEINNLLAAGTLGPAGWTAVGIGLATKLFNIGGGGSNALGDLIVKGITEILNQLDIIKDSLRLIQKNQFEILEEIQKLYEEILINRDVISTNLGKINDFARFEHDTEMYRIRETVVDERYRSPSNILERLHKDNDVHELSDNQRNTYRQNLDILTELALERLNNTEFTSATTAKVDGSLLRNLVYNYWELEFVETSYSGSKYYPNLYNKIGLLQDTFYFPEAKNMGNFNAIINPEAYFRIVDSIISWKLLFRDSPEEDHTRLNQLYDKAITVKESVLRLLNDQNFVHKTELLEDYTDSFLIQIRSRLKTAFSKLEWNKKNATEFGNLKDDAFRISPKGIPQYTYTPGNSSDFQFRDKAFIYELNNSSSKGNDKWESLITDVGNVFKMNSAAKVEGLYARIGSSLHMYFNWLQYFKLAQVRWVENSAVINNRKQSYSNNELMHSHVREVTFNRGVLRGFKIYFLYKIIAIFPPNQKLVNRFGVSSHLYYTPNGTQLIFRHTVLNTKMTVRTDFDFFSPESDETAVSWKERAIEFLTEKGISLEELGLNLVETNILDFLQFYLNDYIMGQRKEMLDIFKRSLFNEKSVQPITSYLNGLGTSLIFQYIFRNSIISGNPECLLTYNDMILNDLDVFQLIDFVLMDRDSKNLERLKRFYQSENNNIKTLKVGSNNQVLKTDDTVDFLIMSLKESMLKTIDVFKGQKIGDIENPSVYWLDRAIEKIEWYRGLK
jgi:hypothetical protein